MSELIIKSNLGEVKAELANRIPVILNAVGLQAEGNAVSEITKMKAVDTGRLRASISHVHDDDSVYIGTNVEYAPYVELGTYRMEPRPFLRRAIDSYQDEYKRIIEQGLK